MATLERPGVEVEQVVVNDSPTVVASTLPACVVGPCFQIVSPLTAEGVLDSSANVQIPARIVGEAVVEPLAANGLKLKIVVGGTTYNVVLPVSLSGNPLSFTTIEQSINRQIAGATAKFVDSKLVLVTNTSGDSTSLLLDAPADNSAYTVLGLTAVDGVTVTGKSKYDNRSMEVPFANLPVTKTAASNLVWDTDNLNLYRYFAGQLSKIEDNSAIIHNSWEHGVVDKLNNLVIADGSDNGNYFQPLVSSRVGLQGKNIGSTKTNTLFHPGTHASAKILLRNPIGKGTVQFPDAAGANYLYVEAMGLQSFLTNSAATIGNYVGKEGNAVSVKITSANSAAAAVWNDGDDQLVITLNNNGGAGVVTTYAELAAVLSAGITGLDASKHVSVSLSYTDGSSKILAESDTYTGGDAIVQYLSGGSDPVNFSAVDATKNIVATMTGSVKVGTADALGVVGEWLKLSLNGGPIVTVPFVTGESVVTAIANALANTTTGYGAGAAVDIDDVSVSAYARTVQLKNPQNVSIDVLQIVACVASTSPYYKTLQESCIQIHSYSSPRVVEVLLSGALDKTKYGIAITPDGAGVSTATSLEGTDYNTFTDATSLLEQGVQPGYQRVTLNSVKTLGAVVFAPDVAAAVFTGNSDLVVTHSVAGTATVSPGVGPHANFTAYVAALRAASQLTPLGVSVSYDVKTLNGTTCLVVADATGTGAVTVVTAGTTAAVKTALVNGATGLFDVTKTSASTGIFLSDTGPDGAWVVDSVTNSLSTVVFAATIAFSTTSSTNLTEYLLDASVSSIIYAGAGVAGDIVIAFDTATGGLPIAAKFSSSTADVTWRQGWPHAFGPTKHDYTGRAFTGGAARAYAGDIVYNGTSAMGRLAAIENFSVGTFNFPGAQLVLTDLSVDRYGTLSDWFIRADKLDTFATARNVAPEISFDTAMQTATIKPLVNRNSAGIASALTAPVYAGYKALRTDVTASAANPSILFFANTDEVETLVGPISTDNPLAFGLAAAFDEVTDVQIAALGVDDVTADAPEGTPEAYSRAFELLELFEVYTIAPLTFNEGVQRYLATHSTNLSAPSGKKERAGICCTRMPTEKKALLAISGTMEVRETAPDKWEFSFTDETLNVIEALNSKKDANGDTLSVAPGSTLSAENGVYLDRAGDAYRYLVTEIVDARTVVCDVGYLFDSGYGAGTGGNDDAYYKENGALLEEFSAAGETCSILVRQAAISSTTTTGKNAQVEALGSYAAEFGMSRFIQVQPEEFGREVNGTEVLVPGYYYCCMLAGATAQLNPAQGFTNLPLGKFTRPIGSNDKYTEAQMATAAAGGVYWVIQETLNGALYSRHQLTTNTTSLKTREWSVIKSIDYVAKTLRTVAKRYIGKYNITPPLLEETLLALNATCADLSGSVVAMVDVSNISVDPASPDSILLDVEALPFFPANKIKIRIYV